METVEASEFIRVAKLKREFLTVHKRPSRARTLILSQCAKDIQGMYFEPMDAEMILWARVAELRDEVGHEDFEEVMELFVEEVAETLERIRQPDCDMEAELHFLKGSAMNLGFRGLALACLNGENSSTSTVDFDELSSIFESSKQALQSGPTNAA